MDEGGSRCTSMVLSIFVELIGAEGGQLLILVLSLFTSSELVDMVSKQVLIKIWMISDHSISINNCLSDRCRWSSLFLQCRVEDDQLNMYRNFRSYEIQLLCSYFDLTNWSNKNKSSSAQQISSVLAMEQIPLLFNLQRVEYLFLIHIPQQIYV